MVTCVWGAWPAVVAVGGEIQMETLTVFTCGGVSGEGAGHATIGQYVVTRHGNEEILRLFVTNGWLEHPLLSSYWEPSTSFIHLGC